jgi:hypothetical protein
MRTIGIEERRARLAVRHRLAPSARAATSEEVAEAVVALHGTDPASVFLAVAARADVTHQDVERALYDDRTLLRMLGMRRTVFTVPVDVAPVVQAACARAIAVQERRRTVQFLEQAGFAEKYDTDVASWLAEVEESTLRALAARGEALATDLSKDEPRLREQILMAAGKPYQAWQGISTRVLFGLGAAGRIVRARPRGTWISSQYRWATPETWLGAPLAELSTGDAQAGLVRRWLAAYGPGTAADLKWWTGLTMGEVKRALAAVGAVEVDLDGTVGLVLPDDVEPVPAPEPWVAMLPALDPTAMGWVARDWYLGAYAKELFDRSGNVGPMVWHDGRIVGGWAHRSSGEVVFRLLEDIGAEATAEVERAADRLAGWLGEVRVTPRFRTALERDLSG